MTSQQPQNKIRINAMLNIVAGVLFLGAAFNVITGQDGINWLALIASVICLAGGVWGLRRSQGK
jgi:predicted branched-subunit amino acid permease